MKLYSKESITRPLNAMSQTGRFVHSYIITGETGTGKKTAAKYIAMQLLCDNKNACGQCRQCRRVLKNQHPDFITVEKEKDKSSYSTDDIRKKVVADCYISPNDCDRKVYFLPDCEGWKDSAQDALLKVTEDPPDSAYFIFTAANKGTFLTTLISRSMTLEVHEADIESCKAALRDIGKYTEEQISDACSTFCGNIGKCIDYLEGDETLKAAAESVKKAVEAIALRDEYTLAVILNKAASNRDKMRCFLEMLARAVRDSACIRNGGNDILGCTKAGSARLAETIPVKRLLAMYDAICDASLSCTRNCNAAVTAAVLAGKLCS